MSGAAAPLSRRKVLFFAEAVTLAHVARPAVLAASLPGEAFDVHLAQHPRYQGLLGEFGGTEHAIDSITPEQFLSALAKGSPLYDEDTLGRYVRDDLRVIEDVSPDVIVGDFRLSLAVSARLAGIPYITISNAYWSPFCQQRYTVPELPFVKVLGPVLGQAMFSAVRPLAFALHCLPMRRLRKRYGLSASGFDLRRVYTEADMTLYADVPQMYSMPGLPDNHRFIGSVSWSPALPVPSWWSELRGDRPIVYVTLGSSGQASALPTVLDALGSLPVTAVIATAGAPLPRQVPANVFVADYLPGALACEMADLVVCNGGSPTAHQALLHGIPVLGLSGNLDQFLSMGAVEQVGAGRRMRAGSATARAVAQSVEALLQDEDCRAAAGQVAKWFSETACQQVFPRTIKEIDVSWED